MGWGFTTEEHNETLLYILIVIVTQVCLLVKTHQIVLLQCFYYTVYKVYLNKVHLKNIR